MANQTYYYPMPVPVNSDHRTDRERWIQDCIEENPELEQLQLAGEGFDEEQVQMIQTCADQHEENLNNTMPWVLGGIIIIFILGCWFFSRA